MLISPSDFLIFLKTNPFLVHFILIFQLYVSIFISLEDINVDTRLHVLMTRVSDHVTMSLPGLTAVLQHCLVRDPNQRADINTILGLEL